MSKKINQTYNEYITSKKSKLEKDFEKECQDMLLSKLLIALNKKDNIKANKLYRKFNRTLN